jgi:hypothetical protein
MLSAPAPRPPPTPPPRYSPAPSRSTGTATAPRVTKTARSSPQPPAPPPSPEPDRSPSARPHHPPCPAHARQPTRSRQPPHQHQKPKVRDNCPQHRSMREAIIETSGLSRHLAHAVATLRETDGGRRASMSDRSAVLVVGFLTEFFRPGRPGHRRPRATLVGRRRRGHRLHPLPQPARQPV